jgi:hypothetical protein
MRTHDGPDKPPRRARLADVAKLAGVSQQTVLNVVNERSGYTEMTRRRVLAATQELDFRPNISARSLRTRRTMRLGYYLSEDELDFRNPIGITFLRDLVVAAEERGYQIDVFTARRDDPDTFREVVARRAVDGFVLSHSSVVDPHPRLIADLGIPFAAMGGPHPTYHRAGSTSTTSQASRRSSTTSSARATGDSDTSEKPETGTGSSNASMACAPGWPVTAFGCLTPPSSPVHPKRLGRYSAGCLARSLARLSSSVAPIVRLRPPTTPRQRWASPLDGTWRSPPSMSAGLCRGASRFHVPHCVFRSRTSPKPSSPESHSRSIVAPLGNLAPSSKPAWSPGSPPDDW